MLDSHYQNCISHLLNALELDSSNWVTKFNLAVIYKAFGTAVINKLEKNQKRTLADVVNAIENLKRSETLLEELDGFSKEQGYGDKTKTRAKPPLFDYKKAQAYLASISADIEKAENHKAHEEQKQEKDSEKKKTTREKAELSQQEVAKKMVRTWEERSDVY